MVYLMRFACFCISFDSRVITAALLLAGIGVTILGCGGEGNGWGCRECEGGGKVCYEPRRSCALPCNPSGGCSPGHRCVPYADASVCDPQCESDLCPENMECVGATCSTVACGRRVPCQTAGTFCELAVPRCVPLSGECAAATDCPTFPGAFTVICEESFCRFKPLPVSPIKDAVETRVEVLRPRHGEVFTTPEAFVVEWVPPADAAVIVMVLDGIPHYWGALQSFARWGAAVAADVQRRSPQVRLADGRAIDGKWTEASWVPVLDRRLYLLVAAYRSGELVAASELVPFRMGSPWAMPGDACDQATVPPCDSAVDALMCQTGYCERVCGSNADCQSLGRLCGLPRDEGPRVCEL